MFYLKELQLLNKFWVLDDGIDSNNLLRSCKELFDDLCKD